MNNVCTIASKAKMNVFEEHFFAPQDPFSAKGISPFEKEKNKY